MVLRVVHFSTLLFVVRGIIGSRVGGVLRYDLLLHHVRTATHEV